MYVVSIQVKTSTMTFTHPWYFTNKYELNKAIHVLTKAGVLFTWEDMHDRATTSASAMLREYANYDDKFKEYYLQSLLPQLKKLNKKGRIEL